MEGAQVCVYNYSPISFLQSVSKCSKILQLMLNVVVCELNFCLKSLVMILSCYTMITKLIADTARIVLS